MVRLLLSLLLLVSFSFADEFSEDDALTYKIKSLIDAKVYKQNKAYIDIIFADDLKFYDGDRVDSVKVIQTLKANGLLNLFFKKPREITLTFTTNAPTLLFMKIMGDTLRNIGYYRYVTKESNFDNSNFKWTISLISEYATDPIILRKELKKSGCDIVDITRQSPTNFSYILDMRNAHLNVDILEGGEELKLKRSLSAYWFDVSKIKNLRVKSSYRNNWYPHIAYYDSSLHLLKVIRRDIKSRNIILKMPAGAKYIKISDIYTLKNIKDSLLLIPRAY